MIPEELCGRERRGNDFTVFVHDTSRKDRIGAAHVRGKIVVNDEMVVRDFGSTFRVRSDNLVTG